MPIWLNRPAGPPICGLWPAVLRPRWPSNVTFVPVFAAAHLVPRVKQCVQGGDIRNELLQGEVLVVVDAVCVVYALMLLRGAEGVEQVGDEGSCACSRR